MTDGTLYLIGTGPGDRAHLTPAACAAITRSAVVVGYRRYLDLLGDLLDGKEIVAAGLREETARARRAIAHAREGRAVALVSSGDAGVYGMAGLALELLAAEGWRPGDSPYVEIIPGITAATAAAALLGAPLMHDWACISLSDLLTPWPIIRSRLKAVAVADFVVCLYNPRSNARDWQFGEARDILLSEREPDTPVGIVRNAGREDQVVRTTTLTALDPTGVDMLTTVIVGNRTTVDLGGMLYTPRGYQTKEAK
ncbi:MAG: precorrin-3B C(17)-methyltransferase [Thermomicrobia bacterium]|nr:precorrin-3B C(17)-methyltransferase [Thermomicrobia bacterium]